MRGALFFGGTSGGLLKGRVEYIRENGIEPRVSPTFLLGRHPFPSFTLTLYASRRPLNSTFDSSSSDHAPSVLNPQFHSAARWPFAMLRWCRISFTGWFP